MRAVILAAGQGTRLRPVTLTMPKPLVPVANKPLIMYSIDVLKTAGLTEIAIVVNDMDSPIVTQLGNGAALGVQLDYVVQQQQLGLAHAISLCKPFVGEKPFCVFLGDNIFQDKMTPLLTGFEASDAEATIALVPVPDPQRFGVAVVKDGKIEQLIEKPNPAPSNLAISGVYLFRPSIWEAIANIKPSKRNELEITDAMQWLVTNGHNVQPYVLNGWWIDAGKPDSIMQANQFVMGDMPYTPPLTDGNVIIGKSDVSHRVEVGEGSQIIDSVVRGPVIIGNNVTIRNSFIGPYTAIGDNVTIEYSEIDASIVMKNCTVRNIQGRIDSSLLADNSQLTAATHVPASHRFILAENSFVQL
ncbi:MAG: glucose-1-phosphate thymidylyltransferase [Chloroflexota bacterium]|nr:glucose-1-phosphate thymidylyltransferase [Chloroflexota bacterium]